MAMKTCPHCGENYSDTYKECPFCEEEEVLQEGGQIRRGGKRVAGGRRDMLTPTLLVLIVLMASLLVYLLKGDEIADKLGGNDAPPPVSDVQPPVEPIDPVEPVDPVEPTDPDGGDGETGVMPDNEPDTPVTPPATEKTDYEKAAALPKGLTLSTTDFTLANLGESHTIAVTGGSGSYQWYSEDDGVASVDKNGKVIAVSGGTVNVVVTDGKTQGTCIVRVKASGSLPKPPAETGDSGSGGAHKLNREDFTMNVGDKFQLKLSGVTTALSWSSSKTSVATVSGDGTVTGVAKGTATVTVSWDGQSQSCIVRIK